MRKVGTLTLGVTLVLLGMIFLIHMFFPIVTYGIIYRVWPMIFILLGGEILFSNWKSQESLFQYDKVAIVIVACLICFSMGVAVIGQVAEHSIYFNGTF